MRDPSSNWDELRRKVLGLGESSVRKTHYPSLMQRLGELERFRSLIDMSSDLLFVVEYPSGRILDVSAACCEHLGMTRKVLLSLRFADLSSASDWEATLEKLEQLRSGARRTATITTHIGHAESERRLPVEIAIQSPPREDGNVILLAARDITERQKAEEQILKLNRLYRVITQVNKAIAKMADRNSLFHEVCRICVEWGDFRLARIALFQDNVLALAACAGDSSALPIPEFSLNSPCVKATRSGGCFVCNELSDSGCQREMSRRGFRSVCAVPLRAQGDAVGVLALYSEEPGFFDEEEVELLQGVASDISFALDSIRREEQRRHAEHMQENTLRKMEAIFEASPLAIVSLDREGRVTIWNKTAEQIFGWTAEEVRGRPMPIVPSNLVPEHEEIHGKVNRRESYMGEVKRRRKDGSLVDCAISVAPLPLVDGKFVGGIAMYTDIGVRKRLEAQLTQANKLESIGRLAGGVAHDFNNLLTVINGHAELLLRLMASEDRLRFNADEILKAGERAADLTRQLLAFSRTQVLQPKVLSCNTIVRNMENMLRRLIGENVQLITVLEPELGEVTADSGQIEQVIMNLVVNARDAIRGAGTITVRTANGRAPEAVHLPAMKPGDCVSISVSDDGMGMDEETQKHIFEPFFTTKRVGEGTGLGLSMVWGIVNQSGGYVDVVSEAGRGTTFTVYLPKAQGRRAAENAVEPDPMQTGTGTLLLVEDRLDVRALTAEILRGCGYKVLETEGPGEALALWQSRRDEIDLVITDVVMPEMTGPELVDRLKSLREDIKVLYVSGHASGSVLGEGALSAGSAFLEKPFSPRKLAKAVHELLAAAAKHAA